ncbi:MAG: LysE family transporter [Deltaproteobacteria bacterium]|nr:LysE family transporter [Deltaproteobacteria bacterium]MBW2633748.1 LysE family transporter [Deltaproteobacteria bacterium]
MDINIFIKGFIIGISIAAPVGPIGVLCIQRTLSGGKSQGLATGLGAASADAVYGVVAAFGLTVISNFFISQDTWFRLIGGAFLVYLGVKAFMASPGRLNQAENNTRLISAYGSTFLLTLANPMTILSFAAIFAGLGLVNNNLNYGSAVLMVLGVFGGSAVWWLFLSSSASLFRNRIGDKLVWLNRISGTIISTFGIIAILSLWYTR